MFVADHFSALRACCVTFSIVAVTAASAFAENGEDFFEERIRPVLVKRCYSCHSEATQSLEGGLALDTRQGWAKGGESGKAIVPGDIDGSLLISAIRYDDENLQMPPDQALSDREIADFEQWVRIGAPDPRTEAVRPVSVDVPSDPVRGREHWAFLPLSDQTPPAVSDSDWPLSSIDHFVLKQLEDRDLHPVDDAERRTLLRRVSILLTGLPPTLEEMESFLADERSDAYERQVDRLLASFHFGERWGRHWLDLARYADSNGLDENFLFREAWRYRNWVISAINNDLSYDNFLKMQIAGDLLPYESIEERDSHRIAAGFLVMGPKVLLGNIPANQRMEVADEQIDTIGRAVLGQTLGCARCHDHKFDPVPTRDYYALAGILSSTEVMEQRYMLGQQRVMEQLIGLGEDGAKLDEEYETYWRERGALKDRRQRSTEILELLKAGKLEEFTERLKRDDLVIAEVAKDENAEIEQRIAAQQEMVAEFDRLWNSPPPIPPRAMSPTERNEPTDEHIRIAGQFDKLGDQVPRGFLQVLTNSEVSIPADQSGRLELANWLTDTESGAGNLAARVLANRIWYHLMGRGLVRTVDNFGRTGETPSHPELLDHLADSLIQSGWSMKSLIKNIVMSHTFVLSSSHDNSAHAVDPENVFLWRAHRRRLDPESLRDAMLLSGKQLDLNPMDSTVWYLGDQATAVGANTNRRRTDFPCRSVYLPVIRNDLPEIFEAFDFTDPHAATGMRPQTLVAKQGLFMLNEESVIRIAEQTAAALLADETLSDDRQRLDHLYELTLNQIPEDAVRENLLSFLNDFKTHAAPTSSEQEVSPEQQAWSMVCQALFASSRFQILE
ncbi:Planctomycete cytochrome C [Thalassoglobus neptunius]|uniref:Planctomycete cytochrome C n=1 Tax=Thalassoglobus neptunius TaxID=1938619 RepID=A0A5C5X7X1_9PLAN|nr:PSD1 and planctomycete cytochrome C domain-containing protein [Thalassoglobus neptunius]TWT58215.1 Planctomycete cytochrome C [Thalassoglobus neptunius]